MNRVNRLSQFPRGSAFPAVPPSLARDTREHAAYRDPQLHYTRHAAISGYNPPYLGMRARLSQVWFNRWTVLLLLVLVRVILSVLTIRHELNTARQKALSACTGVEAMGSAMASLPHYMSMGVNELTAGTIEHTVRALESTLQMMITGVGQIALFIINLLTATYVCLITLAIKGSLGAVTDAVGKIGAFVNSTLLRIQDDIKNDAGKVEDAINSIAEKLTAIPNFFGGDVQIPKVDLPSLDELGTVSIPTDFNSGLEALNEKIPNFEQVQNATRNGVLFPFQTLANLVNQSLGVYNFDRSVFPIPEKQKLTFCSDNNSINDFFDGLVKTVATARQIMIIVLCIAAIVVIAPMAYREWWRYRTMRQRVAHLTREGLNNDPVDIVYVASRPSSSSIGMFFARRFRSTRNQNLVRWGVAYVSSGPALFVLSLAIAGLLACLFQYILLRTLQNKAPELAAEVGEFAGIVVNELNNASLQFAIQTNNAIGEVNDNLNDDVFGWVHSAGGDLNKTLNTFVDLMSEGLNITFGNTILYEPIKDVMNCLIGIKIAGIQRGIAWAEEHAHVTFPRVPNDTFSLGAIKSIAPDATATSSFLADPSSVTTNKISDAIGDVIEFWRDSIKQEAIIDACLFGIWVLLVVIALARILIGFIKRDKLRAEGGGVIVGPQSPNGFTGDGREFYAAEKPVAAAAKRSHDSDIFEHDNNSMEEVHKHDEKRGWVDVDQSGVLNGSSSNSRGLGLSNVNSGRGVDVKNAPEDLSPRTRESRRSHAGVLRKNVF